MATTQYIGARYVPKIYDNPDDNTNNWKQGVEYEPLTMVSYSGGSYTSKVPVPASAPNPADAPQYWAYMGSSSGQITTNTNNISRIQHALANATEAGYVCTTARAEGDYVWIDGILYECTAAVAVNDAYVEGINITPVTDAIKALTSVIASVADDVDGHTQDIANLSTTIRSIQDDIDAIEDDLEDPYTLMIGDSYAEGYDPAGNNAGWCNYLLQMGVRGESVYAGGSGFSLATSDTRSPMYLLQNATLQVPDADIKRIIICEGYNDIGATPATIVTNLMAFINYCNTRFTNATVYVGFCGYAWTHNENNKTGGQMLDSVRAYYASANVTKAVFMPQVVGVLFGCNGLSTADYKHANETGNKHIAAAIWAVLHGQSFATHAFYTLNLANASLGASATVGIDVTVKDGHINTFQHIVSMQVDHSAAVSVTGLSMDAAHLPCLPYMAMPIAKSMQNQDATNGLTKAYYNTEAYLIFGYDNTAGIFSKLINDAGTNYGASKKFRYNDNTYYNGTGSFL